MHSWAMLALVSWEFLLRVQSEGAPAEAGRASEVLELPAGRYSALVCGAECATLRLRIRKHRPSGSVLKRQCRCLEVTDEYCMVCCLRKLHADFGVQPGQRLYERTKRDFQSQLRRLFVVSGVQQGQLYTL